MIKNIIFDFDGVILDSVPVKTEAFKNLFADFSPDIIQKFIEYHSLNGGRSRYIKIKYFFNELMNEIISEDKIFEYANRYSELTKKELCKKKYIIHDTQNFINKNYKKYNMHIASGADEKDLKYICNKLELTDYFISIDGSPTIKSEIVKNIILSNQYENKETILIGDSINDYEAANKNNIGFYAYNNIKLKNFNYLESFDQFL